MKIRGWVVTLAVLFVALSGCASEQAEDTGSAEQAAVESAKDASEAEHAVAEQDEEAALNKEDPKGTYGKGITVEETVLISEILAHPEKYENQRVLVSGTVTDVCPRRGCWVNLASDKEFEKIQVKVTDGVIVFPLSAKGSEALVEGTVERIELDEEQHCAYKEHQCAEKGETFDPASVEGPLTLWQIRGEGAKI